jgi:hypothetical protein
MRRKVKNGGLDLAAIFDYSIETKSFANWLTDEKKDCFRPHLACGHRAADAVLRRRRA